MSVKKWGLSIRTSLTLWYTLLLGITLALYSLYLHLRWENDLRGKLDLDVMEAISDSLLREMLLAVPLILVLAAIGGIFLANRALEPIDRITRTAQEIGEGDLTRRLNYRGRADEVGRLALTFDRMLDRLQATFDREKRFTADASHELRTPLTAIKGRIGMILSQPRSTVQYAETLAQVETQVDRLIRLTKDLLFLSRLDDKRSSWQLTAIDLSDLLAATVEQIQPLATEKGLELIAEIQPQLTIQCEPDYLIGICLNLLDNAIKYTPRSGQIRLQAYTQIDSIQIVVSDTGVGIDPQYLPHLFDRFYRVNSDRARASGGTGLGLAIAYEVVRLHGGSLSVTSQIDSPQETLRVGGACALRLRGTTFTIVLPQK
jgi:heavy metal sensor kinase